MNYTPIKSFLLIALTIVGSTLILAGFVPSLPLVPSAHAAPPNNPAVLGLFNELRKTNTIIDPTILSGQTFVMDLNVTDGGLLKAFDISINFSSTAITVAAVSWASPGCPKAQGCLLDGLSLIVNFNATTSGGSGYRIAIVDFDTATPFFVGQGILFRLTFKTTATNIASVIHIHRTSILQNPANVAYSPIDGYVDTKSVPTANYNIAVSSTTTILGRPVSRFQTNTTSPALSVPLTAFVGTPGTITLKALSLPLNTIAQFTPPTCASACTSSLTITIHGGPVAGSSTTPSGNYSIPLIGNSTTSVGVFIKVAWLKLVVKPPPAPVYSVSSPTPSVNVELGNWTIVNLSAGLISGSNDTIVMDSDCPVQLNGGDCVFKPTGGSFPFSTAANVSTQVSTTTLGLHYIHLLAKTTGTYSEAPRTLPKESLITGSLNLDNKIKTDLKIKFLNSTNTDTWAAGKAVMYDSNSNGLYDTGEPVIAGTAPAVGTRIKNDPLIKFLNSTNVDTWTSAKPVGYDANNNGLYDQGLTVAVNVIKTHDLAVTTVSPPSRTFAYNSVPLSTNPLNVNVTVVNYGTVPETFNVNATAKTVIASDFKISFYDIAHPNITQFNPLSSLTSIPLKFDPKVRFAVYGTNTTWVPGEAVIYDSDNSGTYTAVDIIIAADFRGLTPATGTTLTADPKLKFYDSNGNNVWDRFSLSAESVIYDKNNDNIFESSDNPVLCALGCLSPTGSWVPDETIIYDTNGDTIFNAGDTTIFSGAQIPATGTFLSSDTRLGFVDRCFKGVYVGVVIVGGVLVCA